MGARGRAVLLGRVPRASARGPVRESCRREIYGRDVVSLCRNLECQVICGPQILGAVFRHPSGNQVGLSPKFRLSSKTLLDQLAALEFIDNVDWPRGCPAGSTQLDDFPCGFVSVTPSVGVNDQLRPIDFEGVEKFRLAFRPCSVDDRPWHFESDIREEIGRANAAVDGLVVVLADPRDEATSEFKFHKIVLDVSLTYSMS